MDAVRTAMAWLDAAPSSLEVYTLGGVVVALVVRSLMRWARAWPR